jgi:outer membrane protein assembly factor BamB
MDPEELRAQLRLAAAALPEASGDARAAVARRVRRQRVAASLVLAAATLAVIAAGVVARDTLRVDQSIEFIDTPEVSPNTATAQTCGPAPDPADGDGVLVVIYLPCADTDRVARVYRWVPDRSLLTTVREVFACPTLDERRAGRRCAFDGPAEALVSIAEIDGTTARVTLNDSADGLSGLRDPGGLLAAIEATVFTAVDAVERIELPVDTSDDPDALCRTIGVRAGCAMRARSAWADRPAGWRAASPVAPYELGAFGGEHPTGPLRVGDVVVSTNGNRPNLVRAVSARDGTPRWRRRVNGDSVFLAEQVLPNGVLVASSGAVMALDAASGDHRWTHVVDSDEFPGAPAITGGAVYLPVSFSMEGDARAPTVTALDASSGHVRWRAVLLPDTELQWSPPTVSSGLVIVADTTSTSRGRSHLHALDRDNGERLWTFEFDSRRQGFHGEQPLVYEDHVFAVKHGVLYALDPRTGVERWRSRDGDVTHVFGVAPHGIVVELDARIEVLDIRTGDVQPRPTSGADPRR